MIGKEILHYRILEEVGRGGMGIVYKAHDNRLDRDVALKFLPHDLTSTEDERARFLQEARAAATLNHAHICTIYAIEEGEGDQFIAMEYVDGITLRKRIAESGRMNVDDVMALGVQIGDALHEAHTRGIVHRDVKAENIMINHRNQAKVMDFGLAKLKGSLKLTKTSSTVGTLAYMAPEQIQGGEVDARSDIFSFGVVIFEMLTGRMPFRGEHEAAMMYSILNEEAEPVSTYLPDASPELLHILGRALEKDPEDRYQSVHDMVIDLRRLKKDSSKISRKSAEQPPAQEPRREKSRDSVTVNIPRPRGKGVWVIAAILLVAVSAGIAYVAGMFGEADPVGRLTVAVTDFANNTGEPELDGLSGMLITSMEQSRRLAVMTRARMFDVLKQMGEAETDRIDEDLGRQIALTAGVDALVSASIRKFGKLYSIDLKVLDPKKDEYLLTASEEGEGQESIPDMLDRLSEATRIGLKEKVEDIRKSKKDIAEVTTSNLEAYQYFFQGEEYINRLKWEDAKEAFQKAVELDSTFAVAYYRLAYAEGWNSEAPAEKHIKKAVELIDKIPEREQYLVRSEAARIDGGMTAAIVVLREMEKEYPDDKEMLYNLGDYLYHTGAMREAIDYLERVLKIDPKFERALHHLTWAYRDVGSNEQMLATARRFVSISGSGDAYAILGESYSRLGRHEEGIETLNQARKLFPESYAIPQTIADLYVDQGRIEDAQQELRGIIAETDWGTSQRNAYFSLMESYLYGGRYQGAEKTLSEIQRLAIENDNDLAAGLVHAMRGIVLARLLDDASAGYREYKKSDAYPEFASAPRTAFFDLLMRIYRGEKVNLDVPLLADIPRFKSAFGYLMGSNEGDCDLTAAQIDSVEEITFPELRFLVSYDLALCKIASSDFRGALPFIQILHVPAPRASIFGVLAYPRSFLLMGKAYEGIGDHAKAIENYEKFLDIWKDADRDIPDYKDALARLTKLKASS